MAQRARRRLKQAEFVLAQAENNRLDREVFFTYLEAFIPLGRSVLHILKEEAKQAGAWPRYKQEWDTLDGDFILRFFRDTRDVILKEGHDAAGASFTVAVRSKLIGRMDETIETVQFEDAITLSVEQDQDSEDSDYLYVTHDLENHSVIFNCRAYLKKLEKAIEAAEQCGA